MVVSAIASTPQYLQLKENDIPEGVEFANKAEGTHPFLVAFYLQTETDGKLSLM
ncbi:hypothetical protein GQL78_26415, partial [Escherichia coli]|nr:hypothetical protein [Escherichia coli]